jgi:DDE domain
MTKISYSGYRFPTEIVHQAIWLYLRFNLSFRDLEDLLAERGISVSHETVRRWVNHFGPKIAADLRKRRFRPHTTWHLDEVYLKIDGRLVYLWRAVDCQPAPKISPPIGAEEESQIAAARWSGLRGRGERLASSNEFESDPSFEAI